MKTFVKIIILLFIIGTVLVMIAFASGVDLEGITSYISDDDAYGDEIQFISTTTIDTLDIDLETRNIEISVTTEDHIIITYHGQDKDTWTTSELSGTLSVKQTVKSNLFNWFNIKIPSYEVSTVFVAIPIDWSIEYLLETNTGDLVFDDATVESLIIRMNTGNIALTNIIISGDLDVETDTGRITLNNVFADEVLLDNQTGKISITDLTSNSLNADTSTNNVTLTDSIISGLVSLSTSTGNVTVSNSTGAGFDLSSSTGNVSFNSNINLDLRFDLETVTGNVTVNDDDQGSRHSTSSGTILLKAETTTGNVTVNVQD